MAGIARQMSAFYYHSNVHGSERIGMADRGEGVYWSRFTDGTPQFEIQYCEGKLNGIMRRWAQNGQLILECSYADDVKEGRCRRWHDNGILAEDSFYIDDKLEGEFVQYDKRGNKVMHAKFKNGEIDKDSVRTS